MPKKFAEIKKMPTFVAVNEQRTLIALWCNGSTSDSGSACEGSNPSKATKCIKMPTHLNDGWAFLFAESQAVAPYLGRYPFTILGSAAKGG